MSILLLTVVKEYVYSNNNPWPKIKMVTVNVLFYAILKLPTIAVSFGREQCLYIHAYNRIKAVHGKVMT